MSDGETRLVPPFSGWERFPLLRVAVVAGCRVVLGFGVMFSVHTNNLGFLVAGSSYVLHSCESSRSMAVVIDVFVSVVCSGFCGLSRELVQKRLHPTSQMKIVTGRSIRMTALLRTRMFVGSLKIMPDHDLV